MTINEMLGKLLGNCANNTGCDAGIHLRINKLRQVDGADQIDLVEWAR